MVLVFLSSPAGQKSDLALTTDTDLSTGQMWSVMAKCVEPIVSALERLSPLSTQKHPGAHQNTGGGGDSEVTDTPTQDERSIGDD